MRMMLAATAALAMFAAPLGLAEDRASTKDAEMLVHKAVGVLKEQGKQKALAVFSEPKGPFTFRDLYVTVYDMSGTCLAHGANKARIGKNLINEKDADGKEFIKERIELAKKKGKGWQDFKFLNPANGKVEQKVAYFEAVDDVIIMCGAYKP